MVSVDGDNDFKIDHFIDINKDGNPDFYWDPDLNQVSWVQIIDVNHDGIKDFVFDSDFDGVLDHYYDPSDGLIKPYVPPPPVVGEEDKKKKEKDSSEEVFEEGLISQIKNFIRPNFLENREEEQEQKEKDLGSYKVDEKRNGDKGILVVPGFINDISSPNLLERIEKLLDRFLSLLLLNWTFYLLVGIFLVFTLGRVFRNAFSLLDLGIILRDRFLNAFSFWRGQGMRRFFIYDAKTGNPISLVRAQIFGEKDKLLGTFFTGSSGSLYLNNGKIKKATKIVVTKKGFIHINKEEEKLLSIFYEKTYFQGDGFIKSWKDDVVAIPLKRVSNRFLFFSQRWFFNLSLLSGLGLFFGLYGSFFFILARLIFLLYYCKVYHSFIIYLVFIYIKVERF